MKIWQVKKTDIGSIIWLKRVKIFYMTQIYQQIIIILLMEIPEGIG